MKKVTVLGDGAWGTAVATLLAQNGCTVLLWCHNQEVADTIKEKRVNERYLPGCTLNELIHPVTSLQEAVCGSKWVFEAVPVKFLRSVLQQTIHCFSRDQTWIILSKGIEQETLLLPSQIIDDVFGYEPKKAVLAGPSFAQDLARKQLTAVSIAATQESTARTLQKMLANNYFRPYYSPDLIGVQVGGALKNVLALGIGVLEGAGFTDNAKALLFTRGLNEMVQCAVALGGEQETLYGLSGVGDLVLTSMGSLSRNLLVGKRIGAGDSLETILAETGYIPEGLNTVKSVHKLAQKYNVQLPIFENIYEGIFGGKPLDAIIAELMSRPLKRESET